MGRARPAAPLPVSGVDEFSQTLAHLEERHLLARHADAGAGFRVASDPGSPLANLEAPETADLDLIPSRECLGDGIEDRIDDGLAILLRQARCPRQLVHQIRPRHGRDSPRATIARSRGPESIRDLLCKQGLTRQTPSCSDRFTLADSARERTLRITGVPPRASLREAP